MQWNGLSDVDRKKMHDLAEAERKTLRGNFTAEVARRERETNVLVGPASLSNFWQYFCGASEHFCKTQ